MSNLITTGLIGFALLGMGTVVHAQDDVDCNKCVDASDIAGQAVNSSKIKKSAVTTNKIAKQAVTTHKIAPGAVTRGKIADGAVTLKKVTPKLSNSLGQFCLPDETVVGMDENGNFVCESKLAQSQLDALDTRLTALVDELSSKLVIGDFAATHSGMYDVYVLESNAYGCGSTVDFLSLDFEGRQIYFRDQEISSTAFRSETTTAIADGTTLTIVNQPLRKVQTRLSGLLEIVPDSENGPGIPVIGINPDGTLSIDGGDPLGSMSADGSMFTLLADYEATEGTDPVCTDTASIYITGYRR